MDPLLKGQHGVLAAPKLDRSTQVPRPGTCRGMMCPARRWRLMVSSGAGRVTHCPLLWMAGVRGGRGGGGRLPKASPGTCRDTACHQESGQCQSPCAVTGSLQLQAGPWGWGGGRDPDPGLGAGAELWSGRTVVQGSYPLGPQSPHLENGSLHSLGGKMHGEPWARALMHPGLQKRAPFCHVAHPCRAWRRDTFGPRGLTVCRLYHVPGGK